MRAWAEEARHAWALEQAAELERAQRTGAGARQQLLERLVALGVLEENQEAEGLEVQPGGAWRYRLTEHLRVVQYGRERWVELDGHRVGACDTQADLGRALELEDAGEQAPAEADAPAGTGELLLSVLRALVQDVVDETLAGRT